MSLRPRWHHECVKTAAIREIVPDAMAWLDAEVGPVERWVADNNLEAGPVDTYRELTALLTLAAIESCDAFACCRYLSDFYALPVDGVLRRIIERAYGRMPSLAPAFVHEWVMKNAVRFPARAGDVIRFRVAGSETQARGKVLDVVRREASALVAVGSPNERVEVLAEEVLEVWKGTR